MEESSIVVRVARLTDAVMLRDNCFSADTVEQVTERIRAYLSRQAEGECVPMVAELDRMVVGFAMIQRDPHPLRRHRAGFGRYGGLRPVPGTGPGASPDHVAAGPGRAAGRGDLRDFRPRWHSGGRGVPASGIPGIRPPSARPCRDVGGGAGVRRGVLCHGRKTWWPGRVSPLNLLSRLMERGNLGASANGRRFCPPLADRNLRHRTVISSPSPAHPRLPPRTPRRRRVGGLVRRGGFRPRRRGLCFLLHLGRLGGRPTDLVIGTGLAPLCSCRGRA